MVVGRPLGRGGLAARGDILATLRRGVGHLVLLNTYYGHARALRLPEMIRLFADKHFAPLADAIVADPGQLLWLLQHTARQWGSAEVDPDGVEAASILPQFFSGPDSPNALPAIRAWTGTPGGPSAGRRR